MYLEDLDEYRGLHRVGIRGGAPTACCRNPRVRFSVDLLARASGFLTEAEQLAQDESAVGFRRNGDAARIGGGPAVGVVPLDSGGKWVGMEDRCGFSCGDDVPFEASKFLVMGDRGV